MLTQVHEWSDSHCHFDHHVFDQDRESQWALAQRAGVKKLIIPGVTKTQCAKLSAFASPQFLYTLGFHPCFLDQHDQNDSEWLDHQLSSHQQQPSTFLVGVGECGLDFRTRNESDRIKQQQLFDAHIDLAKRYELPLVLHVCGAHDQALRQLKAHNFNSGGLVHAFTASKEIAHEYIKRGFALGVGGAFSHVRAKKLRRTFTSLPLSSLLLETDSPDMTPAFWGAPHNSPACIPVLAQILAHIHDVPLAQVSEVTQATFARVFATSNT